jgi:hypothetical protein
LKPLEGFPEYDIGWDQLDFTGVEVRDPSRDLFTPGRRNLPWIQSILFTIEAGQK